MRRSVSAAAQTIHCQTRIKFFCVVIVLSAMLLPVARAGTTSELDRQTRILTTVLGEKVRPFQLKQAQAQLAQIETALQAFMGQTTPIEEEVSRRQFVEAISAPHGQELLRALIGEQVGTEQRSRWLLATNLALEEPPSDGSSSGLTKSFSTARESLLGLLSLADNDETAVQLGIGLVRQTQQGYLWRTGIVDGKDLANQLLDGIEVEAQRPGSAITGARRALVLEAIYQEASRWVQGAGIGEVERIYFATLLIRLMDYAPAEAPRPDHPQPQSPPSYVALSTFFVSLILVAVAVVLYRVRPSIHWPELGRKLEPMSASSPKLVPTLADLSEEHIKGKHILVRVDLNILDVDGTLTPLGPLQMEQALTVVRELLKRGASKVILAGHTHRDFPMGYVRLHLQQLADRQTLQLKLPNLRLKVFNKAEGAQRQEVVKKEPEGSVILLDNLAADARESAEKPEDRASLAQELAQLADVYINDAPSASQEARASTVDIASLVQVVAVGPALAAELQAIAEQPEKRRRSALGNLPAVTAMQRVGYL
jgi:hypothetical protein